MTHASDVSKARRVVDVGEADGERPAVVERRRQLVDGAAGAQLAGDEDADPVAHLLHLVQQVRREQHRDALVRAQPLDQQQQLAHTLGVDVDGRLVQDQDRRLLDQRVGDAEPLAHAARELADLAVGVVEEADVVEHARCGRRSRCGDAVELGGVAQVLARRQVVVEADVIGEVSDPRLDGQRGAGRIDAVDFCCSRRAR